MVIGTTSEVSFLDSVGLCDAFAVTYHVPTLKTSDAKKVINIIAILFVFDNYILRLLLVINMRIYVAFKP